MHHLAEKTKHVLIWYTVALVVGVGVVWALNYTLHRSESSQTAAEHAAELGVTNFSLAGKVSVVAKDNFTLATGWVERTESGNKFIPHDKKVTVNASTHIFLTSNGKRSAVTKSALSYLKVGDSVTVYGTGNAYSPDPVLATKIEVTR